MRVIKSTNANITPNKWVISLISSLSMRLDSQKITLRFKDKPEHSVYLKMAKAAIEPMFLDKLDPKEMNGIKVEKVEDQGSPGDLVIQVDYGGYQEPNPLNLTGLRALLKIWVKEIHFNDWKTTGNIKIRWLRHGLGIRIPFESKGHEVEVHKLGFVVKGNINGFYLDLHFVPYVFWFPDLAAARDRTGKELLNPSTGWPQEFWASGRGMHKHRCALFVDFGWDSFSPTLMDAENETKKTLGNLAKQLPEFLPQAEIFQIFEALILGEKSILELAAPSKIRGIDIHPNDAQFLYMDEEVEKFKGKGKIVEVRKDTTSNHLEDDSSGHLKARTDYKGDNIVEVEVEDEKGKRIRISTQNLVESILDNDAEIENAHAVMRRASPWGTVANVTVPWEHLVERGKNVMGPYGSEGGMVELRYNGYLRGNPDAQKQNNLDNFPTYSYDRSKPLFGNFYDGGFFYVYPDLTAFSGLQRTLYPRAWKLPEYDDRETKLLDTWIGS